MRKLSALTLAVCLFAAPVLAGEVNTPGVVTPPPCTENCTPTTTTSATDYLTQVLLELALAIVKP